MNCSKRSCMKQINPNAKDKFELPFEKKKFCSKECLDAYLEANRIRSFLIGPGNGRK